MIYSPRPFFSVQASVGTGIISALLRLAVDYLRGTNKEWAYYLGYGFGGAALATGIPGATATMYVTGATTVKLFFEQSPGAAQAELFLDGVLQSTIDLNAVEGVLEVLFNMPDGGQHALAIISLGTLGGVPDPTDWLSILGIETDGVLEKGEKQPVATFRITTTIRDADDSTRAVAVWVPQGTLTLAQINEWAQTFAERLDAVIDGVITGQEIALEATLPVGLKASPVAASNVEETALISFDTSTPYRDSVAIPTWTQTLFNKKDVIQTGTAWDEFLEAFITGLDLTGASNIAASTKLEDTYTSVARARKVFRRK